MEHRDIADSSVILSLNEETGYVQIEINFPLTVKSLTQDKTSPAGNVNLYPVALLQVLTPVKFNLNYEVEHGKDGGKTPCVDVDWA